MTVLDERGRLFGVVNVVDALLVLLVVAVVVGGIVFVTGSSGDDAQPSVTFWVEAPNYVTASLQEEAADPQGMDVQEGPTVIDSWTNETERRAYERVAFTARVNATERAGRYHYDRQRLVVGETVTIDWRVTVVDAIVVRIEAAPPTPTLG